MQRFLLPIIIIIISVIGYWYISSNAPLSRKRPVQPPSNLTVTVTKIATKPLQITLQSMGQISAKNNSVISSQISGRVLQISANLESGAFFKKGELLVELDPREYQNKINTAKASLTQTQQDLKLEQAQVTQAKADWQRLNKNTKVPALVSRTPQVISAKAKVSAAHANFNQAILDFEHTKIVAPFDGRVLSKNVNIGEFINANTALADIFSTQALQVRLSLKNTDLAFIDLPETNTANQSINVATKVIFEADLIEPQLWIGELVRTEASIDQQSQQLFVIAQINSPYSAANSDKHPLKIGQYLNAKIKAKLIPNAISIDITSIYQGQYVYLLKGGVIHRQSIKILWQDDTTALIGEGLTAGDRLITSILSQDDEGSQAQLLGDKNNASNRAKGSGKKPNRGRASKAGDGKRPEKKAANAQ